MVMLNILHSYQPNPIAFHIGQLSIHWYGIFLVVAILVGYWLVNRLSRKSGLSSEVISSIYINTLICGLIGARVYHVIFDWTFYVQNPLQIFAIWNGGLAIHGAIIGAVLCILYFARKPYFWRIADLFVVAGILGQAIGRFGNYFNQELFGRPTDAWIGIPIDTAHRPLEFIQNTHFHPTFLYESLLNLMVFIILLCVYKKQKRPDGLVFWMYIGLYSLGRIAVESLRINDAAFIFGVRLPLLVSILFVVASLVFILRIIKHQTSNIK